MEKTKVVGLKAVGGKIVQSCDVYIGRAMTMSTWGVHPDSPTRETSSYANRFKGEWAAVEYYKWLMLPEQKELKEKGRKELRGRILGCWCVGKKNIVCHGQVWKYVCDEEIPPDLKEALTNYESTQKVEKITLNDDSITNRIRGMLAGHFQGDALGAPYEFDKKKVKEFVPHLVEWTYKSRFRTSYLGFGQVTDDTEMSICLADNIVQGYSSNRAVESYIEWSNSGQPMQGHNTSYLFKGIGTLSGYKSRYRKRFAIDFDPEITEFEETEESSEFQSNGSLMRCASIAVLKEEEAYLVCCRDIWITNPSTVSASIGMCYIRLLKSALRGESCSALLNILDEERDSNPELLRIIDSEGSVLGTYPKGWIGEAMTAVVRTVHMLNENKSYEEIMNWIIGQHPGTDTDTNAAIAGALIGAHYGYEFLMNSSTFKSNMKLIMNENRKTDNPRPLKYSPRRLDELTSKLRACWSS